MIKKYLFALLLSGIVSYQQAGQQNKALHAHREIYPFNSKQLDSCFGKVLCLGPNNTLLAGCNNGLIFSWNTSNDKTTTHPCCLSKINSMIIYAQETTNSNIPQSNAFIVVGDASGSITYLDPQSLQILGSHKMHTGAINCLTQLPGGLIASGGNDNLIKIWQPQKELNSLSLKGHSDCINSLTSLPDNKLASCSDDGQLKIWNLATQQCEKSLQSDPKSALHLVFIPPYSILVSNNNGTVRHWDITSHKLSLGNQYHEEAITKTLINMNGDILTSSTDHTILFIHGSERVLFKGHSGTVFDMLEIAPGIIASCSRDGYIHLWYTPKESFIKNSSKPHDKKTTQTKNKLCNTQITNKK